MKKLLALILVLTLVLSMGSLAFATPDPEPPELGAEDDWSPIKINKELDVQGLNPSETFNFTIGAGSGLRDNVVIPAPAFDPAIFEISVGEGETAGFANINLPVFTQVGVYTYPISETAGKTAGFDYDDGEYNLVITVINNPAFGEEGEPKFLRVLTLTDGNNVKKDAFKNSFDSGDLTIKKEIKGNYADPDDEFEIIVTLTPVEGKVLNSSAIEHDRGTISVLNETTGEIKIAYSGIKGGDSFTIQNIPYDVNYLVEEVTNEEGFANGYTVNYDELRKGLMNDKAIFTTITNTRITEVPMGVNLDNLPYVLILGAASVGLVAFTLKRRFSDDR
jgi:pilin isopeptide linkage protein